MNTSIRLCFCVFMLAHSFASSPRPPVGPPSIQCIQGNDDQVMSLHLLETGRIIDLNLRYRTIQQKLTPGNRRYNLFWTEFESTLPSSAPMTCPSATLLVPANEVSSFFPIPSAQKTQCSVSLCFGRLIGWQEDTTIITATTMQHCRPTMLCCPWTLPSMAVSAPQSSTELLTMQYIQIVPVFRGLRIPIFVLAVCHGTTSMTGKTSSTSYSSGGMRP